MKLRGMRLELRWRLSLVIGVLLTAALTAAAVLAVANTREAVLREVGASLRTATASLDLTLDLLREHPTQNVQATLQAWSAGFSGGRHLCVSIESSAQAAYDCVIPTDVPGVPAWFARGAEAAGPAIARRFASGGRELRVHLVPDPRDELREAWSDVRSLLLLMGLLAFSVNLCIFMIVSHGLQPLHALVTAMGQIGRGNPAPQLPRSNAPEVQMLSDGLGQLATRLELARETVRGLHLRNLDMQEEERRMVARELHDEIGQHVAAIEMETIRIARMTPEDEVHRQSRLKQLRSSVTEIHRVSRRIVHRLRPPQIENLGLSAALEALCDRWRAEHPEAALKSEFDSRCDQLAPERALHLYRLLQESLSNVARHARANRVWVLVQAEEQQVRLQVMDDGLGFNVDANYSGFGLAGMHERVEALGGSLRLRSKLAAGTVMEASIPLHCSVGPRPDSPSPPAPVPLGEGSHALSQGERVAHSGWVPARE